MTMMMMMMMVTNLSMIMMVMMMTNLSRHIWVRPRHGHTWPLGCTARPNTVAFEGRCDLDNILLADADFDLTGIVHHLDTVPITALVTRLGLQSLETATDLPGGQVATGGDELNPEGHRPLSPVGELKNSTAWHTSVVHKVELSHLVQVK